MVAAAGSVGEALYFGAARGGAQALDRDAGRIEVGALADLVAIDTTDPAICALSDQQLLDGVVFAAKDTVVSDLWSAGRHQVRDRRHVAEDKIIAEYRKAVTDLRQRLG
jgi:cytosine/adenosine deaminase-related metal-dependent hydrolase